jgi:hypothetical protein
MNKRDYDTFTIAVGALDLMREEPALSPEMRQLSASAAVQLRLKALLTATSHS